jgi:hypothetical protein
MQPGSDPWLVIIVFYLGNQASANPETTPSWEPILGRAGQGLKMDPRKVTRLVERTAIGEGGRGWVSKRRRVRAARDFVSL